MIAEEIPLPSELTRKQRAWLLAIGALTLITGLYAAALYYNKLAKRSACEIIQSSIYKGTVSYDGISQTPPTSFADIVGPNGVFNELPTCPGGGTYTFIYDGNSPHKAVKCSCKGHDSP